MREITLYFKTALPSSPSLFLWLFMYLSGGYINTLRPRQTGRHFADDIFKCIFVNEDVWIPIKNSLKFVSMCPINNILALVQIMAWRREGDKPLSEPMLVSLPTHIWVTRPQWVKATLKIGLISMVSNLIWKYVIKSIFAQRFIFGILVSVPS